MSFLSDRCLTVTSLCHYRRSPAALTLTRLSEIQIGGRPQEVHLLDVSDEKTVFQSGLNYKVIQTLERVELGEDDILDLRYMTLDSDEQKVMQSIIDSWDDRNNRPLGLKSYVETCSLKQDYEFLLMNSWKDKHDFLQWHNSENSMPAQFGHAGNKSAVVNQYVSAGKQHLNRYSA